MVELSPSARLRTSPYYDATMAAGMTSATVYNHMLMPTSYGDPLAEYWRLIEGVAMWDVACERQVELRGPDAGRLAAILTPRNLANLAPGQGRYVPVCDHEGRLLNDPVLLKLAEDRYWLSIADGDLVLWARAVGAERGLNVHVFEPDVSPLAVQGPKAMAVVAALLGDSVKALKPFAFEERRLGAIPLVVARSGWSKQGGFELYLCDPAKGLDLWHAVAEAGRPFGIGPGTPNQIERIESGLLSYGTDTDADTNPFEAGLGRWCDLDRNDDFIGKEALRRIRAHGPRRRRVGFLIEAGETGPSGHRAVVERNGAPVGFVAAWADSPRLKRLIGLGLIDAGIADGAVLTARLPAGLRRAEVTALPFRMG